jgi:hypothetical protein
VLCAKKSGDVHGIEVSNTYIYNVISANKDAKKIKREAGMRPIE